jgi:hypothetical protein
MTAGKIRLGVGMSTAPGPIEAAAAAAREALQDLDDPLVALVFATPDYDAAELAEALTRALGEIPWAGCSALGVFAGVTLSTSGVVVGVIAGKGAVARVGLAGDVDRDPREAGRRAVERALEGMPTAPARRERVLFLLPDSRSGSAAEVLRGALAEGGNGVVWAGGGAGDMTGHTTLHQFAEGAAHVDSVVAVAIDLPGGAGTGVAHGWRPFGSPALVTRAQEDLVQELEYRSAFDVYREAAALNGTELTESGFSDYAMFHPLGIPQADEHFLIRDPVAVSDGGLRCVAAIPEGALVRTMHATRDAIVSAADDAATRAASRVDGMAAGAIIFDCMSRHLILGASFADELVAYRDALGQDVPVIGCLTFGEIASFGREVPQFHNKTTVVVAIASEAQA